MSTTQPPGIDEQQQPTGEPLAADDAPNVVAEQELSRLTKPKLEHCASCRIGLLYPIAWDADASHEANQGLATDHENFVPSGGAALFRCFNCGLQTSQPLKPGQA